MPRAAALLLSLLGLMPATGCLDSGSSDDSSGGGSSVGGVVSPPDPIEGCTVTYAPGHPLDWQTTNTSILAMEDDVNSLVNNHRVALGLPALIHETARRRCARGHSRHMTGASHDFFDHQNPEGDLPWDRMTKNGITYGCAGENIAYGYGTAAAVVDAWLKSDGHRANIERPQYKRTGVGYQTGAPGSTYYTQVFTD